MNNQPKRNSSGSKSHKQIKRFGKPEAEGHTHSANRPVPPSEMPGLAARRIALRVIRESTEQGAWASLSLDAALRDSGLSAQDRRLASRLAYDTLDRLIYLDWALSKVMARPDTDIRLRNILRLGACQILLEDRIPESAATNTCVQLCVENGMPGLKGVCNGILRNLVRIRDSLDLSAVQPSSDARLSNSPPEAISPEAASGPAESISPEALEALRLSLPLWLWRRLKADFGPEAGEIARWRHEEEGWLIRPNLTLLTDADFEKLLAKKVWEWERTDLPHAYRIRGAMNIGADADFRSGRFSIQTAGSLLTCLAMAPKRGETLLDCCAAPGGKSCLMAEMMGGTGRVQAWDLHEHRTALIAAQVRRLGLENVRPMTRDALILRPDLEAALDGVLLDAPCSGTGMMAEKPDLKSRLTEQGLLELISLQEKLLETVSAYVRPGGRLVYSTCSILREENGDQIRSFLARHPEFEPEPLPETIPERFRRFAFPPEKSPAAADAPVTADAPADPGLLLKPWRDGTEGFYLCRLRRLDP